MKGIMQDGYSAHEQHKLRTDNPYLKQAISWDKGWLSRQKEQLQIAGMARELSRLRSFGNWISGNPMRQRDPA